VAKRYRELTFTYNATSETIEVPTDSEEVAREDIQTIRQAADGTRYYFTTGYKRRFTYTFNYSNEEVFEFFLDAFDAFNDEKAIQFGREQDDGTTETVQVIVRRPVYADDNVGTSGKVYRDITVELLEI
jgi:hypothetical protein